MQKVARNEKSCSKHEKLPKKIVEQPVENPNFKYSLRVNKKNSWGK